MGCEGKLIERTWYDFLGIEEEPAILASSAQRPKIGFLVLKEKMLPWISSMGLLVATRTEKMVQTKKNHVLPVSN